VMCAYNSVNGQPACASDELLGQILRGEWKFDGHVVSDCAAIEDIYKGHKFVKTEAEASALAVRKGTDLTCGKEYKSLSDAVKQGLIKESEIDTAVKRLMTIRFRLGMFDPPETVRYAQIPVSENDSAAHRELSLRAARESLVLLKNDNNALPLRKDLKTVAVIGPNADDAEILLGNYNGQPSKSVTPLEAIKDKLPRAEILYSPGMYPTGVVFEPVAETAFSDLKGEYFNNRELKGEPALVRRDAQIAFNWGAVSPAKEVSENDFSVRWTAKLSAPESGKYQFGWRGNGGVRIFLDNQLVVDEAKNPWTRSLLKEINLEAGKTYDLRVEYFENANLYAASKLVWSPPTAQEKLRADALEKARQSEAVVMVMGISPMIEGEEMDVKLEGFRGGDRTDIALPKPQQDLIKAVHALGKPVILVLMGGSALAVNWESENIPAILHAWYPGQEGGTAIADVLFGDYNPAGRLPVTFYKSVADLPPFEDYKMAGRTYRYFKGELLYPFGYGLSYTKFAYSNLKFKRKIKTGENLQISVEVRNTGATEGEEVVQLYVANQKASFAVPIRSLEGFNRIALKPNERKTVSFTLAPRQLSVVPENGKRIAEAGEFLISVGGKQPGFSGRADAATTTTVSERLSVSGKTIEIPE
ncbi:MAG: glycoside hydrolase family 3 C-terminal domain-containing protein, partial [Acidobacteriota bacterium]|nr:glycoside hydrolase family 3 C-terminal domain-containing protein [Acidobacteriota bacterium]